MKASEKPELLGEDQLTNDKFLSMHVKHYRLPSGKMLDYAYATRGKKKGAADAVRVILYFTGEDGQTRVLLIREFRYPIGKVIYETVAGLVDEGETLEQAVMREAKEEVGAYKLEDICLVDRPSFTSAGISDETAACFEARIASMGKQKLEEEEKLSRVTLTLNELEQLLDSDAEFCLASRQQLRAFLYKRKYLDLANKKGRATNA